MSVLLRRVFFRILSRSMLTWVWIVSCVPTTAIPGQLPADKLTAMLSRVHTAADSLSILERETERLASLPPDSLLAWGRLRLAVARKVNQPDRLVKAYAFLAEVFDKLNRPDSGAAYALQGYLVAREARDTLSMWKQLQMLGGYLMRQQKNKEAIVLLKAFLNAYGPRIPDDIKALMYGTIGAAYEQEEAYVPAVENYLRSLEFAEKSGNARALVTAYYNLGYLYILLEQPRKAIDYLTRGLEIARKKDIDRYIGHLYERLAAAYRTQGNIELAKHFMKKAIEAYEQSGNLPFLALAKRNLAALYYDTDQYDQAILLAREAIELAGRIGLEGIRHGAEQILILSYLYDNRLEEAKSLLEKLDGRISPGRLDPYARLDYYSMWYEYYSRIGDYRRALDFFQKRTAIEDSIHTAEVKKQVREIEEKYQNARKLKEIYRLRQEKAQRELALHKARQHKIILATGLTATFLVFLLTAVFYVKTKRKNRIIENLQREIHHRIKNNLAVITSLVDDLEEKYAAYPGYREDLKDLKNRIANIYQIHRQLYDQPQVNRLSFKTYLDKLSESVRQSYNRPGVEIHNLTPPTTYVDTAKSLILGLIINEFLLNSFKHAFHGRDKGKIILNLHKEGDTWVLDMRDDGRGLPEGLDVHNVRSFGLEIMQLLAKQLGGEFKIRNEGGVRVQISFPG